MFKTCRCCDEVFDTKESPDSYEDSDVCMDCVYSGRVLTDKRGDDDDDDDIDSDDDDDDFDDDDALHNYAT